MIPSTPAHDGFLDESFLNLTDVAPALRAELARALRATVRGWTGIPTCVGIGSTKTLAKRANHIAKTVPDLGGVCDLTDPAAYAHWLCRIDVAEVWGIGRASLAKLEAMDACNARRGRGAVVPARAGLVGRRDWTTKSEMRTPQVGELPLAQA